MDRDFTVVLRGYDRAEVDKALERAEAALHGGSGSERAASLKELGKASRSCCGGMTGSGSTVRSACW